MKRPTTVLLVVLLAICALVFSSPSNASNESYKVIVNPSNPVKVLDRDFLRDVYLKKAVDWNQGQSIRPIDLSTRFAAHDRFRDDVIRKTSSQLKSYWNQQIFSGKGVPPPEADSTADVIAYVLANPGAVGYLPPNVDPGGAKVIGVD